MQALERLHPSKPMRPGQPEKREFEYRRHGTRTLIASLEVATGRILAPSIGPTRKKEDFIAHVAGLVATDPDAVWVIVVDNLDTHRSHALVDWVAEQLSLQSEVVELRQQRKLETKDLRAAFLAEQGHRIRFVYTPKHCSWLNQIELWFGTLTRTILRRASFASVDALTKTVLAFIRYYNEMKARPYDWNYTGRPVGL
jgi:transposase